MIGKTLGHYEITNQLGKGGMGEVYQAKDLKLGRNVAIKVLPEEFAKETDRVARFQREATLLASLNHPNIAAIYGLEESGETDFLVLELVEGETLADKLKRGPTPVEESLKLALQIAEALEAAHEKGIIHRDLKPGNIKVTPEGKVKVLDFGLAKLTETSPLGGDESTHTMKPTTEKGIVLGTPAYMSPEQAKGQSVDKRADVWAFGVVLYEMLTSRQLFAAETISEVLAAVLTREPDFSKLPAKLHPKIIEMLERCLEKEARNRYSGISDARVDIQKVLGDPFVALARQVTSVESRNKLRPMLPWIAVAVVLAAIITGVADWKLRSTEPRQVIRMEHYLPLGQQFNDAFDAPDLAVSPNGKKFAYSTPEGIYLRSVDELTARLIAGTETNPVEPFFSPDGQWIGYFSADDKKLKKIAINGGVPVTLCDVNLLAGASWRADNTIVYGQIPGNIMQVSASGGIPKSAVKANSELLVFPQVLSNGKSFIYLAFTSETQGKIRVQSLESGESKELFTVYSAQYLPTGHMVYQLANNNNLFAIPFDLDRLEVTGVAASMVEGVSEFAISDSGTLVYIPSALTEASQAQRTLVWVDRKGKETPIAAEPNIYATPCISPDGTKVALTIASGENSDIWIWEFARETMTRLTFNETSSFPLWTLDGQRIAFTLNGFDTRGVYWKAADGTGSEEKLDSAPTLGNIFPSSWSRDGRILVLLEAHSDHVFDIASLSLEDHKRKPLLQEKYSELQPEISPDGRWMAYSSDESGKSEIYVRPFPEVNMGKWQVSTSGGALPLWSPDGRELFYRNDDSVVAAAIQTEPTFKCGIPMTLFQGTYYATTLPNLHTWDISPDGKRFLMMKEVASTAKPAAAEGPRKINIVLNWFEELKQRVPVK